MNKRFLVVAVPFVVITIISALGVVNAQEKPSPYIPEAQVMKMMEMLMAMEPDTLKVSIERGKKLFNDNKLGNNKTGLTCNACHPNGGTAGGTSLVEWKGMKMNVPVPTLKGASAHFPAVRGPMKKVVSLKGMNNMCIMTFLKGAPLDENSQEAIDLESYVASFSQGSPIHSDAKPTVPK